MKKVDDIKALNREQLTDALVYTEVTSTMIEWDRSLSSKEQKLRKLLSLYSIDELRTRASSKPLYVETKGKQVTQASIDAKLEAAAEKRRKKITERKVIKTSDREHRVTYRNTRVEDMVSYVRIHTGVLNVYTITDEMIAVKVRDLSKIAMYLKMFTADAKQLHWKGNIMISNTDTFKAEDMFDV